jgi:predicted nuclease with TOPRIM domain
LRDAAKHEVPFKERAEQVFQIQALLTEINGVKEQIKRLQSQITILFADEDKVRACNLLKTKLENLFKELEQLAK